VCNYTLRIIIWRALKQWRQWLLIVQRHLTWLPQHRGMSHSRQESWDMPMGGMQSILAGVPGLLVRPAATQNGRTTSHGGPTNEYGGLSRHNDNRHKLASSRYLNPPYRRRSQLVHSGSESPRIFHKGVFSDLVDRKPTHTI